MCGRVFICEGIECAGVGFSNVRPRQYRGVEAAAAAAAWANLNAMCLFFFFLFLNVCKTGCSARATLNSPCPSGLYSVWDGEQNPSCGESCFLKPAVAYLLCVDQWHLSYPFIQYTTNTVTQSAGRANHDFQILVWKFFIAKKIYTTVKFVC